MSILRELAASQSPHSLFPLFSPVQPDCRFKVDPTYDPPAGQEFTILTCTKREGTFAEVIAAALSGGKRFEVSYEETSVKLRVAQ